MNLLLRLILVLCAACHAPSTSAQQKNFIVAAAHPLAADAGYEVLKRGGSSVDAAIAVQLVLGLVEPESSGIGGGAFLLHWSEKDKKLRSYDGRETAPTRTSPEVFLRQGKPMAFRDAVESGLSVGVPGVLRMLELAHKRHGKLAWSELFQPAIAIAEAGFTPTPRLRMLMERERFEVPLKNPEYAEVLRSIARDGADAFYRGPLTADMVRAVRSHAKPGRISAQDFADYRAVEREPVCAAYRVWRICSMAPPSSGGVAVLQILGILERTDFARAAPQSALAVHYFSEAGRLAYADRARYLGDPDFVSVPIRMLLSGRHLSERAKLIGERSMRTAPVRDTEAVGTSHLSIVDAAGDAVSMTTTIEATFGSRILVRGFLLNNQLTDFDFTPGTPNEPGPRKRPRSSMAPTMVFSGERLDLLVGSPGGPNIINYVAKALVGTLDWKLDIQSAIALPNFGSRNGPTLLEKGSSFERLRQELEDRNHPVELVPLVSGLHGIERVPGGWRGGADPRRDGAVRGD